MGAEAPQGWWGAEAAGEDTTQEEYQTSGLAGHREDFGFTPNEGEATRRIPSRVAAHCLAYVRCV